MNRVFFSCLILLVSTNVFSGNIVSLQKERLDVIRQYVDLLGKGNYQFISRLFTKNAIAVSSSGIVDNPPHFYKILFTKTIKNPQAILINIFDGVLDKNMKTAYFEYAWKNIKGQRVSAKFLDLFVFKKNTAKIKAVFVFSNTFQTDIMKQLE